MRALGFIVAIILGVIILMASPILLAFLGVVSVCCFPKWWQWDNKQNEQAKKALIEYETKKIKEACECWQYWENRKKRDV